VGAGSGYVCDYWVEEVLRQGWYDIRRSEEGSIFLAFRDWRNVCAIGIRVRWRLGAGKAVDAMEVLYKIVQDHHEGSAVYFGIKK